jgi:hypothetical protein
MILFKLKLSLVLFVKLLTKIKIWMTNHGLMQGLQKWDSLLADEVVLSLQFSSQNPHEN